MMNILSNESACKCPRLKSAKLRQQVQIFGNSSSEVLFLLSHRRSTVLENRFLQFLERKGFSLKESSMLFALGCSPEGFEVEDSVYHFITCKEQVTRENIKKINPKVIVAEGKALYTIAEETRLNCEDFYNYPLLSTTFYSPEFGAFIIPIPELEKWFNYVEDTRDFVALDNFHKNFTSTQLEKVDTFLKMKMRKSSYECKKVENFEEFYNKFKDKDIEKAAIDTETRGLCYFKHDIISIQFCFDGHTGYFIEWQKGNIDFIKKIDHILSKCKHQIFANGIFDLKFLKYNGIKNIRIDFDVNYANHFVYSARHTSLKAGAFYYTDLGGYESPQDKIIRDFSIKDYGLINRDVLSTYACLDVIITYRLEPILLTLLNEKQKELFYNVYIPLANLFVEIEMKGIPVNLSYLREYREKCLLEIKEIEDKIHEKFKGMNISSEDELGEMFKVLNAKDYGRKKNGKYRTSEDIVLKWKEQKVPFAEEVLSHKHLKKMVTTYLAEDSALVKQIGLDNRVHVSFKFQSNWVSRLSCSEPNAQQWPIKSNPLFRPIIRAPEDYYLAEVDFSGFHLRLVAMASEDKTMREMFTSDKRDMHSMTAAAIFTKYTFDEFLDKLKNGEEKERKQLKDYRNRVKAINFGLIYGLSYQKLSNTILQVPPPNGWSLDQVNDYLNTINLNDEVKIRDYLRLEKKRYKNEEKLKFKYDACAKNIREKFFERYPGIQEWIEVMHFEGKKKGYVDSFYGFRIYLPELLYPKTEGDNSHISNLLNVAVNGQIIGTEANIMQRTQIYLDRFFKENKYDAYMVNQIHDSLLIEFKKELLDEIKEPIHKIMTKDFPEYKGVPLDAEGHYGEIWGGSEQFPWKLWFE